MLSVSTLVATHRLTGQCLADILQLIAIHCPPNNNCLTSLYKFHKFFSMVGQSQLALHYFCSNCTYPLASRDDVCENNCENHETSYFIEMPIETQIQSMFKRPDFYDDIQHRFNRTKKCQENVQDIYDGSIYREHFENNGFLSQPNHISFMWYTDGISIYNTSKYSLWPLYFSINEFKYCKRTLSQNTILAGIWFGNSKPNPNVFLQPFFNSLDKFKKHGYYVKVPGEPTPLLVKGMLLCGVCDLPAKALFLRFKQYNGAYGCCSCEIQGAREIVGNTTVQVYPYSPVISLRNNNDIPALCAQALELQKRYPNASVHGVKGLSPLYKMVSNMVKCTAVDAMHGVFSGVSKLVLELITSSSLSHLPFSVAPMLDLVDNRLCKFKPPSKVQRLPTSIKNNFALWHASDHKYWFFYYSIVVLLGIWSDEYLEHHCKLVSAIFLLSQISVSHAQIRVASLLLHSYVKDFQYIYGIRYQGMNVHQLLHLVDCVQDLGPLWVFSCFHYEDKNGKLSRLVHGTRYAGIQVSSSASVFLKLPVLIEGLPENSQARQFCNALRNAHRNVKVADTISPGVKAVGKYKSVSADIYLQTRNALQSSLGIMNGSLKFFERLLKQGVMYCSAGYNRCVKRDSSYVSILENNVQQHLGRLLHFVRWSPCEPDCNIHVECDVTYFCVVTLYEQQAWFIHNVPHVSLPYLNKVVPTNNIVAFPVEALQTVCFYLNIGEAEYIALPVNNLEVE